MALVLSEFKPNGTVVQTSVKVYVCDIFLAKGNQRGYRLLREFEQVCKQTRAFRTIVYDCYYSRRCEV